MNKQKKGLYGVTLISIIGIVGMLIADPIAQDIKYHMFKDHRTIFGISNFWNVVSNLPFLLVGIFGLHSIIISHKMRLIHDLRTAYLLLFGGLSLVALGSGYYHLNPNNASLVLDRLPMTIVFMSLFSIIIGEFISVRKAKLALWPLVAFGAFSVVYWYWTELQGEGDLRLYVLVQFLPMAVIPLILLFFKPRFTGIHGYWQLLFTYALAKVFEHLDLVVYNMLTFLSGHSVKHLVAGLGIFLLLNQYNNRELIQQGKAEHL